jgi:hypothetical protein
LRARQELVQLSGAHLLLTVATPTLLEAHRLILFRLGRRVAARWLDQISRGAGLVSPTTEDVLEAASKVHRFPDQAITLHDGVLAVLSRKLSQPVWTFDRHLDVLQALVWR